GLPILEAMAQGTPVVTSANGATEEVAGGAAVLVDPLDTASIADGILRVIEQRDALSARARDRAQQLSWKRTAQLTREVYAEAVADGPRTNKSKR
ncbi:MAG: glycosyltransferase, partial [Actinomycetota bacterium]